MEIFLVLGAAVVVLYLLYTYTSNKKDAADAGVVLDKPVAETKPEPVGIIAQEVAKVIPEAAVNTLDVNKDGKVDLKDAKEAVKQTVAKVKSSTPRSKKKK